MQDAMKKPPKPKSNSEVVNELEKAQEQFDKFDQEVKSMTMDRMNASPKEESEPQTKLSSREIDKKPDIYLKPERSLSDRQKFNEDFRKDWNFQKEYVQFIAEHKEIIGEVIEIWTHEFGGTPCEFWKVPTNKPLWGPRYLAERIKNCRYHRLTMQQSVTTGADGMGQYYGALAVDTTVQRLDALPVSTRKSVFMGVHNF
jgi:hypothetical protein